MLTKAISSVANPNRLVSVKFRGQVFFDRSVIKKNWKRINETPLKKAGLLVRRIARGSIRRGTGPKKLNAKIVVSNAARNLQSQGWGKRESYKEAWAKYKLGKLDQTKKRKPSKPGKPPKSWPPGENPPFKLIYSVPNKLGTSVIVGMVGFRSGGQPVPGLHEKGGRARRRVYTRQTVIGEKKRDAQGRYLKRTRTKATLTKKTVRYRERPFMVPAVRKGKDRMPQLWRNSIRK